MKRHSSDSKNRGAQFTAGPSRAWKRIAAAGLVTACSALTFTLPAHALGLGDISIQSYLGQPLSARVALISNRPEELTGMSAGLASAESFRLIGLDRLALSVPLQFTVEAGAAPPYIQVRSTAPVNDPVLRFVIEVEFANGRLLREYTLFLDPPSYTAPVPLPAVTRPPARTAPEIRAEPAAPAAEETAPSPAPARSEAPAQQPRPEPAAELPSAREIPETDLDTAPATPGEEPALGREQAPTDNPLEAETAADSADPARDDPAQAELAEAAAQAGPEARAAPAEPAMEPEEEPGDEQAGAPEEARAGEVSPVAEAAAEAAAPTADPAQEEPAVQAPVATEPEPSAARPVDTPPARPAYQVSLDEFETYGPVERGETLWAIASRYVEDSKFTINQAMLSIQRYNPDAFANGNINYLHRGAILRLPPLSELALLSAREAMLEVMQQEREFEQIRAGRMPEPRAPLFAERSAPRETVEEPAAAPDGAPAEGRLELVPPHEAGVDDPGSGAGDSGADASVAAAGLSEEELANVEQESAYLTQQIEQLEAEIGARQAPVEVSDPELAALQEQQNRAEPEPPMVVTPPGQAAPWVERLGGWWLALPLLLVAAVLLWLRRVRAEPDDDTAETVRMIASEAEEILHALDAEPASAAAEPDSPAEEPPTRVIDLEQHKEDAAGEQPGPTPAPAGGKTSRRSGLGEPAIADAEDPPSLVPAAYSRARRRSDDDEEAVELDAEDPETKLDLARAYIAMGEYEPARELLSEVLERGDEAQVQEAREMLAEI